MACYRLTFDTRQVFEVVIDGKRVARDYDTEICVGILYRVTHGARETEPLHRQTGGPIEIYAITEDMTLLIAKHVLREVTGSEIAQIRGCGVPPVSPLLDLA